MFLTTPKIIITNNSCEVIITIDFCYLVSPQLDATHFFMSNWVAQGCVSMFSQNLSNS